MKASRAAASLAFSRQRGISAQLPPSSRKHSTSGGPSSARTTSPIVIDWAGRASVKPPPTPRWVEMKPLSARSRTTLARWLREMPNSAAISLVANDRARLARQPHQGAQGKIRERRQAHGVLSKDLLGKSSIAV